MEPKDPEEELHASAKYDGEPIVYEFFVAGDLSNPIVLTKETSAGSYVLRVSIADGKNTDAVSQEFNFEIIKDRAVIESAVLSDKDAWFYRDYLDLHGLTYTVSRGKRKTQPSSAIIGLP